MSEIKCDDAILAAMAEFDGEELPVSSQIIRQHLAVCESCSLEIAEMQAVAGLLQKQKRTRQSADLWQAIENRIEPHRKENVQNGWSVFALLAVFLIAYKLLEMLPQEEFGFLFKFVPLVFAALLFAFLRENPFKINTQLTLEK